MTVDTAWTPVESFLPHINDRVLVICVNPNNKMERHVSICTFFGKNENGALLWSGHKKVTHWMSCPELPSEDKKGVSIKELGRIAKAEITYQDIFDDCMIHFPKILGKVRKWSPVLEHHRAIFVWTDDGKYYYSYGVKQLQPAGD